MLSDLVVRNRRALPPVFVAPKMSALHDRWVWLMTAGGLPDVLPDGLREEARVVLPRYEATCASAGAATIGRWLFVVNGALSPPVGEEEFRERADAIAAALEDLPAALFTRATAGEAAAEWKHFPGAAMIVELFHERSVELRTVRASLRSIANAPDPPPPVPEMSLEERERATAGVRAALDRIDAEQRAARTAVWQPTPVADAELLAMWEAEAAKPGASVATLMRRDGLRRKLGIDAADGTDS